MSVLKKIFGSGDNQDEDVMYQSETTTGSTAVENQERTIQSERDTKPDVAPSGSGLTFESQPTSTTAPTTTQPSDTGTTTATAGAATGAAAAATGATVYASDRVESDDRQADLSQATYTERSYPLSADSSSKPATSETQAAESSDYTRGGEAAAGTAVFGGTVLGAGAYAASSRDDNQAQRFEPSVPGDQPSEREVTPYPNTSGAASVGTVAAAGAGGAALSTYDVRHGGYAPVERERFYGRPPSSPPASPPAKQTTFSSTEYHGGRDAAIAGGSVAAAGAAGAAGYAATQSGQSSHQTTIAREIDPSSQPVGRSWADNRFQESSTTDQRHLEGASDPRTLQEDPKKVDETEKHYGEMAAAGGAATVVGGGAAYAATQSTDDQRHLEGASEPRTLQEDPKKVDETEKHYGEVAAAGGAATVVGGGAAYAATRTTDDTTTAPTTSTFQNVEESSGQTKQGFFSKIFHGENKDMEAPIGDQNPTNEVSRAGDVPQQPGQPGAGGDGLITLVKSDSAPDDPALVVREKPGGGIETVEPGS